MNFINLEPCSLATGAIVGAFFNSIYNYWETQQGGTNSNLGLIRYVFNPVFVGGFMSSQELCNGLMVGTGATFIAFTAEKFLSPFPLIQEKFYTAFKYTTTTLTYFAFAQIITIPSHIRDWFSDFMAKKGLDELQYLSLERDTLHHETMKDCVAHKNQFKEYITGLNKSSLYPLPSKIDANFNVSALNQEKCSVPDYLVKSTEITMKDSVWFAVDKLFGRNSNAWYIFQKIFGETIDEKRERSTEVILKYGSYSLLLDMIQSGCNLSNSLVSFSDIIYDIVSENFLSFLANYLNIKSSFLEQHPLSRYSQCYDIKSRESVEAYTEKLIALAKDSVQMNDELTKKVIAHLRHLKSQMKDVSSRDLVYYKSIINGFEMDLLSLETNFYYNKGIYQHSGWYTKTASSALKVISEIKSLSEPKANNSTSLTQTANDTSAGNNTSNQGALAVATTECLDVHLDFLNIKAHFILAEATRKEFASTFRYRKVDTKWIDFHSQYIENITEKLVSQFEKYYASHHLEDKTCPRPDNDRPLELRIKDLKEALCAQKSLHNCIAIDKKVCGLLYDTLTLFAKFKLNLAELHIGLNINFDLRNLTFAEKYISESSDVLLNTSALLSPGLSVETELRIINTFGSICYNEANILDCKGAVSYSPKCPHVIYEVGDYLARMSQISIKEKINPQSVLDNFNSSDSLKSAAVILFQSTKSLAKVINDSINNQTADYYLNKIETNKSYPIDCLVREAVPEAVDNQTTI